jgi:DNA mismatch repair protein MutL
LGRIAVLHPMVSARIAAGEVVERPAAILRELLENSLDAGATTIDVRVDGGGFELLRVDDNGCGMSIEDVSLCVERHGTSKLRTVDDLNRISTLGYRGEALTAIMMAADLEILSADGIDSTLLRTSSGRVVDVRPAARSRGTTITVHKAFQRLPARRASLGSPSREGIRCQRVAVAYALGNPGVRFRFVKDGHLTFHTLGDNDLRRAAASLHSVDLVDKMRSVAVSLALPSGTGTLVGLIGEPSLSRRNKDAMLILINGRPVSQPEIVSAVQKAYGPALPAGRHPVAILSFRLPPEEVDPNVHPGKLTVRLSNADILLGMVRESVAGVLCSGVAPETNLSKGIENALETSLLDDITQARWLGQWANSYLVLASDSSLYLVDQHAAAERVLYDQLRTSAGFHFLAVPVIVTLGAAESAVVQVLMDELEQLGFELDPAGPDCWAIRRIPAAWQGLDVAICFKDLLADLASSPKIDCAASVASLA